MIVTADMLRLRRKPACKDQVDIFEEEWPDGAEATLPNCLRAVELDLDLSWFVANFLSASTWKVFRQTIDRAWEGYDEATASAWEASQEATARALYEALTLEKEDLVKIEPKWGATVVELSKIALLGRYVIREALEGMAARLASQKITAEIKNELINLAKECDRELVKDVLSPHEKARLHYRLHEKIAKITDCEELISALDKLHLHTIILSNAYHIDWRNEFSGWHQKLIDSLVSGNPDLAEKAMRDHVKRGYEMERKALSSQNA